MVRLKSYLSAMDERNTKEWKEMYEGKVVVPSSTPGNASDFPEFHYDTTYWADGISYSVELTNKASYDKPTILCKIPAKRLNIETFNTAVADDCYRQWCAKIEKYNEELYNRHKPPEETGWYYTANLGQEILLRNSAYFEVAPPKDYYNAGGNVIVHYVSSELEEQQMCLCIRFQVQLVKNNKKKAIKLLVNNLPIITKDFIENFDIVRSRQVSDLAEKQRFLREWLNQSEYCAFIANGSILPREYKTKKAKQGAIPFRAPETDEIEIQGIKGMGIRKGVTIITGGGYSGKSTILNTISAGIYDHILGDGRELCVTNPNAITITAEDGRSVKNLDISAFISWLPNGDVKHFSTEHASGSTSQAANILEAIDYGAELLLIDEDRSATNFMIRDVVMKALIRREPITPFTERVNELYDSCGVSTILVIGGSGEYLSVADTVYLMDEYNIFNVTANAKEIYARNAERGDLKNSTPRQKVDKWNQKRMLMKEGFTSYPKAYGQEKLAVLDVGYILIGLEKINTNHIHEIVCDEQRTAIGFMIRIIENRNNDERNYLTEQGFVNLEDEVKRLYHEIDKEGMDCIYSGFFPNCERFLALPREMDFLSTINRMRFIKYNDL